MEASRQEKGNESGGGGCPGERREKTKRAFAEDQFMDDSLIPQKTWYQSKGTET